MKIYAVISGVAVPRASPGITELSEVSRDKVRFGEFMFLKPDPFLTSKATKSRSSLVVL